MEIEKIVSDTKEVSKRLHDVIGPWEPSIFAANLAGDVGTVVRSVMIIEGKHPASLENVRLEFDIAHTLYSLVDLCNACHIDLERAWNEFIQGSRSRFDDEEFVKMLGDRIRLARERQRKE
jgi:hypothetical protein